MSKWVSFGKYCIINSLFIIPFSFADTMVLFQMETGDAGKADLRFLNDPNLMESSPVQYMLFPLP